MALKRRRYGRRRLRRRLRRGGLGRRRIRYISYKSKKRGVYRRKRSGGAIKKLMKALLPTVPIKYVETKGVHGVYSARSWYSKTIGNCETIYQFKDYLPGQSNIFDDGTGSASTTMSLQQYACKKLKAKHYVTITGQNTGNTTQILTAYICKFRRDTTDVDGGTLAADTLYKDCTPADKGKYLIDTHSAVPATSTLTNFYNYPQFTLFHSSLACSKWLVVKTKKLRVPPGGWFKFKLNTGYKEFDSEWLTQNHSSPQLTYLRNWSKTLILTWHGELVQKVSDVTTNALSSTDIMMYMTHNITLKAVPYHRQSTVFSVPVGLSSGSTLGFTPQIRPTVVVEVTKTGQDAEEEAKP